LRIQAGDSYKYEFKIADDQEGGTHWYHPHSAGSSTLQAGGGGLGLFIVEDEEGDLPDEVLKLPEVPLRIQFFNFTYLQEDYSAFHPSSYVELCKKHCIPAENRYLCSEYFFENGPEKGSYNRTIAPDGLEYETLLVNGVERPTITLSSGQWYRFRTLFVPTRFRTIEPSILDESCDFQLLAKDGHYIPTAPRKIRSGFMTSGSRVDFLVRCHVPGTYEFRSLSESRDSSNWIASQKRKSLDRVMAFIKVVGEQKEADVAISQFKVARPCYLPDLTSVTPDHTTYILMSGLNPELPTGEALPEERPAWGSGISYYAINNFGALSPTFLNEEDEDMLDFSFELSVGSIWEVDYFVPQIHPWHQHIFPYQVISFPKMDTHNDFFQDGDYHDVLLVPIGGDETEDYGKAVIRTHLDSITGQMLGHCHFYRHTDRGMALVANIVGQDGTRSDNVSKCYSKGGQMTFDLV
jgi:FtsP/CotA-like multicopper oxidase with cupredoxin domain